MASFKPSPVGFGVTGHSKSVPTTFFVADFFFLMRRFFFRFSPRPPTGLPFDSLLSSGPCLDRDNLSDSCFESCRRIPRLGGSSLVSPIIIPSSSKKSPSNTANRMDPSPLDVETHSSFAEDCFVSWLLPGVDLLDLPDRREPGSKFIPDDPDKASRLEISLISCKKGLFHPVRFRVRANWEWFDASRACSRILWWTNLSTGLPAWSWPKTEWYSVVRNRLMHGLQRVVMSPAMAKPKLMTQIPNSLDSPKALVSLSSA